MTLRDGAAPAASPQAPLGPPGPVSTGTLVAALQPVVRLDGALLGYEALLRRVHEATVHPAGHLVAEAVAAGSPVAIDGLAVRLGLQAWAHWAEPNADLFLNAPPMAERQLPDWLSALTLVAHDRGVALERLVVELHEHQPHDELRLVRRAVEAARGIGLRFALDDVDASPRSLSLVRGLEPEVVKLDGSVVRDLTSPTAQRRVARLMRVCAEHGCLVVAEQVETPEQVDHLVALGIYHVQGYLTGPPVVGAPAPLTAWRWQESTPA